MEFVNRLKELQIISDTYNNDAALLVIYGRRRIGKTRLLRYWGESQSFVYSQAVEGAETLQIDQLYQDLKHLVPHSLLPRSWPELLAFLALIPKKTMLVIDEFPYLAATNASLPSLLQKWLEQTRPDHLTLVLMGSSQRLMYNTFLAHDAPLYQRAARVIRLRPLNFKHFMKAVFADKIESRAGFRAYSMLGGVPKYWAYVRPQHVDPVVLAEELFFDEDGPLRDEPFHLLKDESISGTMPLSILQSIGEGDSKPSDIAKRLAMKQTSLSWSLKLLTDSYFVRREVPFGESEQNAKKTWYGIDDPMLAFWFRVFSPHRSRWFTYPHVKKQKLIDDHCSLVLENLYRQRFPGAKAYWEGSDIEIDCIRPIEGPEEIAVEVLKWRALGPDDKLRYSIELKNKFLRSKLAARYPRASFQVLDGKDALQVISE